MVSGPRSLPWSLVPCPFCHWTCPTSGGGGGGGTPVLSLVLSFGGGTLLLSLLLPREGVQQPEIGVPPGQDRRYPFPSQDGGNPPPPTAKNQDDCAARAVCLLRSRRRTFLFILVCYSSGTTEHILHSGFHFRGRRTISASVRQQCT